VPEKGRSKAIQIFALFAQTRRAENEPENLCLESLSSVGPPLSHSTLDFLLRKSKAGLPDGKKLRQNEIKVISFFGHLSNIDLTYQETYTPF
jgi:hypothetical protein